MRTGVRVLVSLKAGVLVSQGTNHESGWKTWNITGYDAPVVTPPTVTFTEKLDPSYGDRWNYAVVSISQNVELNFAECKWMLPKTNPNLEDLTIEVWESLSYHDAGNITSYDFEIPGSGFGRAYPYLKLVDVNGNVYFYVGDFTIFNSIGAIE